MIELQIENDYLTIKLFIHNNQSLILVSKAKRSNWHYKDESFNTKEKANVWSRNATSAVLNRIYTALDIHYLLYWIYIDYSIVMLIVHGLFWVIKLYELAFLFSQEKDWNNRPSKWKDKQNPYIEPMLVNTCNKNLHDWHYTLIISV